MMDRSNLPLEGIRVVDRGVIWAGPFAAWMLSLLGAEVIHLDTPFHAPDLSRTSRWPAPGTLFPPLGAEHPEIPLEAMHNSTTYDRQLWNRVAFSVNLGDPEGVETTLRLIEKSDIFLENNSAHAMESIGIGHEVMMERNPRLICINAPGWGRSGPYKEYVGWGALHEALCGHTWLRGYADADHPKHNIMRFHMDSTGGSCLVVAAIMGLIYRRRTGRGVWVDLGQIYTVPHSLGEVYLDAAWNGRDHRTLGNRHPTAIQGCYPCRGPKPTIDTAAQGGERWINITITDDEEWEAFCQVLNNPEWTKDPKFATHESRRANHDELDRRISEWTLVRDNVEVMYALQKHGVCAGIVKDPRDHFADAQLNARDFFVTLTQDVVGTHRYSGIAWRFSKTPLRGYSPPALMGEHTEYVCKDVIGMSDAEYEDLKTRDVVGRTTYSWQPARPDYEGYAERRGWEVYGGPEVGHISAAPEGEWPLTWLKK